MLPGTELTPRSDCEDLGELMDLGPPARFGQIGEYFWVMLSVDQGVQHGPTRDPGDVGRAEPFCRFATRATTVDFRHRRRSRRTIFARPGEPGLGLYLSDLGIRVGLAGHNKNRSPSVQGPYFSI